MSMFFKKATKIDEIFTGDLTLCVKLMVKISSIFVAFLENMNFKHTTDFEERRNKNLVAVAEARKKVQSEISDLKEKVKIGRDTVAKFKSEILRCQTERGFQNPAGSATVALL